MLDSKMQRDRSTQKPVLMTKMMEQGHRTLQQVSSLQIYILIMFSGESPDKVVTVPAETFKVETPLTSCRGAE